MINKFKFNFFNQREAVVLSATFLLAILFMTACKKDKSNVGEGVLPEGTILESAGIDTFSLRTYSVSVDSVQSLNPRFNLLGKLNDQFVGNIEASFYTELSLSSFEPDFGDFNDLKIDSAVAAFRYAGYYGTPMKQTFEVYEITEPFESDKDYYHFSTLNTNTTNLVPTSNNEGEILPRPTEMAVVGNDTVNPQLRIPIDTTFARDLLALASQSSSNESFKESFNGLHFKVSSPMPQTGSGAVMYLESTNAASKMTIYYTQYTEDDTLQSEFDILIRSDELDFNAMQFDNTGTPIEQVINDTLPGQETFFAQAFQARAKVEFPSLKDIPESAILQSARLILPVSYFQGSDIYPSEEVAIAAKIFEDNDQLFVVQDNVQYNQQFRAYVIDLRQYIQRIVNDEIINDGIIISPRFFNTSTERILFNGPLTTNKTKPKLDILYTEF